MLTFGAGHFVGITAGIGLWLGCVFRWTEHVLIDRRWYSVRVELWRTIIGLDLLALSLDVQFVLV